MTACAERSDVAALALYAESPVSTASLSSTLTAMELPAGAALSVRSRGRMTSSSWSEPVS